MGPLSSCIAVLHRLNGTMPQAAWLASYIAGKQPGKDQDLPGADAVQAAWGASVAAPLALLGAKKPTKFC